MRRSPGLIIGVSVLAIVVAITTTSCTMRDSEKPPTVGSEGIASTVVQRRDLLATVTLDATVTATPEFVLLASTDGIVRRDSRIRAEAHIQSGAVIAKQGDQQIVAPVPGTFVKWLVPDRAPVHKNVPIAVLRYAGFGLAAQVPASVAYRFYTTPSSGRAQINGGQGPFECQPLYGITADLAQPVDGRPGGPPVVCAIPAQTKVFAGLTGVVAVSTGARTDVLAVPVGAVAGDAISGRVVRIDNDGSQSIVDVGLGLTDGAYVEITSGLSEGDRIALSAPNLRPGN
ncbi:MAG TPA: hypothetical protein VFX60_06130 [Micromonospora sp.]|nr:hypothetical protein [Micromonospora sp.]